MQYKHQIWVRVSLNELTLQPTSNPAVKTFHFFYEDPVKCLDSLYGLRQNPSNSLTREWIKAPVGFSLGQSKKQEVAKTWKIKMKTDCCFLIIIVISFFIRIFLYNKSLFDNWEKVKRIFSAYCMPWDQEEIKNDF